MVLTALFRFNGIKKVLISIECGFVKPADTVLGALRHSSPLPALFVPLYFPPLISPLPLCLPPLISFFLILVSLICPSHIFIGSDLALRDPKSNPLLIFPPALYRGFTVMIRHTLSGCNTHTHTHTVWCRWFYIDLYEEFTLILFKSLFLREHLCMCLPASLTCCPLQKIHEWDLRPVGINRPPPADSLSYFKAGYESGGGQRRGGVLWKEHEICTSSTLFRIFLWCRLAPKIWRWRRQLQGCVRSTLLTSLQQGGSMDCLTVGLNTW